MTEISEQAFQDAQAIWEQMQVTKDRIAECRDLEGKLALKDEFRRLETMRRYVLGVYS